MKSKNHPEVLGGNTRTPRSRNWCFTKFDGKLEWNDKFKYLIQGDEVCPTSGRQHYQGYIVTGESYTFKYMKKHIFTSGEHFEIAKGDHNSNIIYCSKDGKATEEGTRPSQGKRTDLIEVKDKLKSGVLSVDDIILNDPMLYHQYGRTLTAIEDRVLATKYRTEMTVGIWLYGATGVGKSHIALINYKPETHYIFPDDNGWWDNYRQQHTVVFNDFRGAIAYSRMLELVDKWPTDVKRRGRPPMPFTSSVVIVTSSLPPSEVYYNLNEKDKLAQLLRRFKVFNLSDDAERIEASYVIEGVSPHK